MDMLASYRFGFMGCGNMTQTIIRGWLEAGTVRKEKIFVSNRSEAKLERFAQETGVNKAASNEELLELSDVVLLAVKPQDMLTAIDPLSRSFTKEHVVISMAAGVSLASLQRSMPGVVKLIRIMPNTPVSIRAGVVGYCLSSGAKELSGLIEDMFTQLGLVVEAEEGQAFEALTVSAASGVGFVFELMLYWQEWLEGYGFEPEVARSITVNTFLGASKLAASSEQVSLDELLAKVTSKKGVTAAGLNSMRELELERGLRYSFEKAVLRDRELAK